MKHSRILEDVAFLLAVLLAAAYVVGVEILPSVGWRLGPCEAHEHGIPWGLVLSLSVLAAPKTLGRATAGKVWDVIAKKLPGNKD